MSRRKWTLPPGSVAHPGALETPTLANLTRRSGSRRRPQCRICLADDDLKDGVCRDRVACESRQPPLIPLEEL